MKKLNAAIRDANAALEIKPDSAKGHKSRGMARAMLGQWEEAAKDLHVASNIDYDEVISAVLKKVEPNGHRIEEHRRKYDRLRKEREDREAEREDIAVKLKLRLPMKRLRSKRRHHQAEDLEGCQVACLSPVACSEAFLVVCQEASLVVLACLKKYWHANKTVECSVDPELMAAFKDAEIMAALQDVMKDPANLSKHQSNPKVAPIIAKMMSKFAGPK